MAKLAGKQIYVVGPLKAQNRLMASFLAGETGAECEAVKDFHDIQLTGDGNHRHAHLALWDCFGRDKEGCLSKLDTDAGKILAHGYLALFNLIPWSGIEEEAVARGARGFFYLEEPLEQFKQGVHVIFKGELWVPRKIMSKCIIKDKKANSFSKGSIHHFLTGREVEILHMVAAGYPNSRIADELCISPHTVKTHLYNTYKKIKVPGRLQAALWAVKNL